MRRTNHAYYPLKCFNLYTDQSFFTAKLLNLKYKKAHSIKYENTKRHKDRWLSCETFNIPPHIFYYI